MSKLAFAVLPVAFAVLVAAGTLVATADADVPDEALRPNIIFILVDDMGYGDLSYTGQENFTTPNLDRMAEEGLFFSDHYAGSTVCAPSRAALLTGNHTGRLYQRGNGEIEFRPDPHDITIASRLQHAGYHTAMIGKSGLACLSDNVTLPNDKGFDHFFGLIDHRDAHRHYPEELIRNGEAVSIPGNEGMTGETYAGDLFLEDVESYLEDQAGTDEPFFLHFALQQPHADLAAPGEFLEPFVGEFDEDPHRYGNYYEQPHPKAAYAAMITYLDHSVGKVLEKLDELDIAEDTLVIFSSDNGGHSEGGYHHTMFDSNAPLRGYKRDLYEGGIRVPTIAWWPGTVEAGTRSDHISAFWDFAPTALQLAGLPVPDNMDGISYVPTLLGNIDDQPEHAYLYWEFYERGGRQAVRMGDWKGVRYNVGDDPDGPIELYNLADDIGEENDVADEYPEIVEKIDRLMDEAHEPVDHFQF